MTTFVACDACEQPIGRPHTALVVHVPAAGLIFHAHDGCLPDLAPKISDAREAVQQGPAAVEDLRLRLREA